MLHHLLAPLLALLSISPPARVAIDTAPVLISGQAAIRTTYLDGSTSVQLLQPRACDDCEPYVATVLVWSAPGNTLKLGRVSDVGRPNNGANNEVVRDGACDLDEAGKCVYAGTTCRFDAHWELTALDAAGNRVNPCTITVTGPGLGPITDTDGRVNLRWLVDQPCGMAQSTLITITATAGALSGSWQVGLSYGCDPCGGTFVID